MNEGNAWPRPVDVLPHRDAMLLIDTVIEVDDNHAVCQAVAQPNWPTARPQGVSSLLAIELVAQTVGVCNVWGLMRIHGEKANKSGWLVAIKKAVFHVDTIHFHDKLIIRAENGFSYDMFREATGRVYHNDQLIAEIVIQIYQAKDQPQTANP
ncbi:MAG: hypothetical protein LBU39_09385 [Desulfobulbaceae bacterium]|nr:hypothetical protein [Desulfobulbaceae bacterium]